MNHAELAALLTGERKTKMKPQRALLAEKAHQRNLELRQMGPEARAQAEAEERFRVSLPGLGLHLGNLKTLVAEIEEVLSLASSLDHRRLLDRLRLAEIELRVAVEQAAKEAGLVGVVE